jgi:LacI family transcriptional regulator
MSVVPTVYDVAARAGVSIATVSRTLRLPETVRPETRQRVTEAARELGYVPSGSARGLARKSTGVLGICFIDENVVDEAAEKPTEDAETFYWDEVIRGVERAGWRHDFAVLIAATTSARADSLTNDIAGRVDALAILAQRVPTEELAVIAKRVPTVLIAARTDIEGVDSIQVANSRGMRQLVRHLIRVHDCRSFAFIGGPAESHDAGARFSGFRRELREQGLPTPTRPFHPGDFTITSGAAAAAELLAAGALPDAIVCANDQMAVGVVRALVTAGVRVPGDVRVTGFDGIEPGRHLTPALTTVRQPMRDMGRLAVELLINRLAARDTPAVSRTLPVEVVTRASCGCP